MGPGERRGLRRRPPEGDHLRRVRRWDGDSDVDGDVLSINTSPIVDVEYGSLDLNSDINAKNS